MNKIIKERLALIQSGTIPHGYKKTKAGIMPEDWDGTVRAKDVFKNHTDKKHNGDFEILAATQENGIVPRSQIEIDIQCSEEGINGYKKVSKGDFVISLRSFQGGIEYSEYDGIVSPAYTVLQPVREISDGYYRNYFKTASFIQRLNGAVYGIRDGKQIGYQDFGDMYIHCPPLDEQKKIAEILAQCDRVIQLKENQLEAQKKEIQWFGNKIFKESAFPSTTIGNIGKLISGQDYSQTGYSQDPCGCPYLTGATNIENGQVVFNRWTKTPTKIVKDEDILIVCKGSGVGKMILYHGEDAHIARQLMSIRVPSPKNYYVYYALQYNLETLKKMSKGLIEGLDRKSVLQCEIAWPPEETQLTIANYFKEANYRVNLMVQELIMWKRKKKSLMQLLLTGLVRVKP